MGISATERHLFLVCPDDLQRYFSVCYDLRGASKMEYNVKATHQSMRRIFHDVPFRFLSNGYFIVTELLCANSPRAVRVAQLLCREAGCFEASAVPTIPLAAPARRRSPPSPMVARFRPKRSQTSPRWRPPFPTRLRHGGSPRPSQRHGGNFEGFHSYGGWHPAHRGRQRNGEKHQQFQGLYRCFR